MRGARAHALRSVVHHETRRVDGRRVGYLRIFSFNVSSARLFAQQVAGILRRLPPDGLIVDIRGNPGGHVPAAEAALQLLTATAIAPATFSLATTPLALDLCRANPAFRRWADSVSAAVETGETYSQAFPLSDPGRDRRGPAALPRPEGADHRRPCYSAADIFAAGFQDNGLGPVLGTARHTGAGGANVWTHDLLRVWLGDTLGELPGGAGFRVALRRVTRVERQRRRAAGGPRRPRRRAASADAPRHHGAQPGPRRARPRRCWPDAAGRPAQSSSRNPIFSVTW